MRRMLTILLAAGLAACAPVLDRKYMQEGARDFQLAHLTETPEVFRDRLFILGGVIVDTKVAEDGSQIEALFVPVDKYGSLKELVRSPGRFLARYPKTKGVLDPMIFKRGRQITVAADFVEARKGKIDQMEYTFPLFEIREIYLWEEYRDHPWAYSPYYYPSPVWCYDPWGRPAPCPPWYRPMW